MLIPEIGCSLEKPVEKLAKVVGPVLGCSREKTKESPSASIAP